jgi:hypothetical protein
MAAGSLENLNERLVYDYFENFRLMRDNHPDVYLEYPNSDEPIPSLKLILAIQSSFFKDLFYIDGVEKERDDQLTKLTFSDTIPLSIFLILHDYVFNPIEFNVYSMDQENFLRLFKLVSFYQFREFRDVMIKHFTKNMTRENCWELLNISVELDEVRLGNVCGQFIAENEDDLETNHNILQLDAQKFAFLIQRDTFLLAEEKIFQIALSW